MIVFMVGGIKFITFGYMVKEQKIVSIQYLRGLAALGVVLCHYGSNVSAIFEIGQTGVYVFFLLSGFVNVYSLEKHHYKPAYFFNFLLKRSIRIDPSYIVTIGLTILLFYLLSFVPSYRGQPFHFSFLQLLSHIIYITPFTKFPFYNHVFWTLCIEFQFYMLIGCLYFVSDKPIYKIFFILLFSLSCLIPLTNSYYVVFTYAPMFAVGIALVGFYKERTWKKAVLPAIIFLLILYKFGFFMFALLLLSSFLLLYFKLSIKVFSFLGDISYSLYLIHTLVLIVLLGCLKKLNVNTSGYQIPVLIFEVATSILIAYIFYILVEHPATKLSKRIKIKDSTK
jgi:exopolysaccharide production protein ExoZ